MAGLHQSLAYDPADSFEDREGIGQRRHRYMGLQLDLADLRVVRPQQFIVSGAYYVKQVAGLFEGHIDGLAGIINYTYCRDEQGGNDGQMLTIGTVLVVEAIFARDKWHAKEGGGSRTAHDGLYQHAQLRGIIGIAPAEIIQDGGSFNVSAHSNEIA